MDTEVMVLPDEIDIPIHPIAAIFPLMDETSLNELAEDIKANGLLHPIVIHEGAIVDGRNRYIACRRAGIEPQLAIWEQGRNHHPTIGDFIWAENVKRRHLEPAQIAFAGTQRLKIEEEMRAAERRAEKLALGPIARRAQLVVPERGQPIEPLKTKQEGGRAERILAKKLGVSRRQVGYAVTTINAGRPDLVTAVIAGQMKGYEAAKKARNDQLKPGCRTDKRGRRLSCPQDWAESGKRDVFLKAEAMRMDRAFSALDGWGDAIEKLDIERAILGASSESIANWKQALKRSRRIAARLSKRLLGGEAGNGTTESEG